MDKNLETAQKYLTYATIFLVPLFLLPVFPNFLLPAKTAVLAFGVALILLVKMARTIIKGSLQISLGSFDIPLLILAAAYIISSIIRTPNKMEAFFLPGTATIMAAGVLLYFMVNDLTTEAKKVIPSVLFSSGVIASLVVLVSVSGLLSKLPFIPEVLKVNNFSLIEGNYSTGVFFATLIPLALGFILQQKDLVKKAFVGVATALVILGLAVFIYNNLPGKPNYLKFPGTDVTWSIAVDTLKENPLWGIGPGNYLTAFNRFRPISFNASDIWTLRYSSANNFYFTLLTEVGLVGFAGLILLGLVYYKVTQKDLKEQKLVGWGISSNTLAISLGVLLILLAIFPASITVLMALFVLLAANSKGHKFNINLAAQGSENSPFIASRLPAFIVALPVVAAVIYFGVFSTNVLAAEAKFKTALDSFGKGDGKTTYEQMRSALTANPYVDRYHSSLAQVDLVLANAIAKNAGDKITDADKNTIAQLIQEAIQEGKATVSLNPQRAQNWEILASTYESIIPYAQGSDQFAIQSYSQAVALDPLNTNYRINLGGVYYSLKDYDNAIDTFKLSVATKADFPNARYNLAVAYREKGEIEKAITEMTSLLSLLSKDSEEYNLVKTELDNLEKKRPAKSATEGTGELVPPQGTEKPALNPKIQLPESATPPSPEASIVPQATATPNPVSSASPQP